jgi:S-formylglutathione hydrolase
MNFSVFVPPGIAGRQAPALYFLAGLTCSDETFMIKAGAQRLAAQLGLILVACDTSPRSVEIPGDRESWDFGIGAGFYVDATEPGWKDHYRMASYVNRELPALVEEHFGAHTDKRGIFGHSMGGHGALVIGLRHPQRWHSLSALAPIANPTAVPWGQKAFSRYLGPQSAEWEQWDASCLMRQRAFPRPILVDQGLADEFLTQQLRPEALEAAAHSSGQALTLRRHERYGHGYWFIQSVVADHLEHHSRMLQ